MWMNKNASRNISAHVRRSSTAYMSRYNLIKPFVCIIAVVHENPLLLSATTRPCSTLASQLVSTHNCRFASNFFPLEFQLIKWIFSYSCVIFFLNRSQWRNHKTNILRQIVGSYHSQIIMVENIISHKINVETWLSFLSIIKMISNVSGEQLPAH